MAASYKKFRAENTAPKNARDIGVYKDGVKVGRIPLGCLAPPPMGKPLYSFGLLADIHVGKIPSEEEGGLQIPCNDVLLETIEHLKSAGVDFIISAGDTVDLGKNEDQWIFYRDATEGLGEIPMYCICGNSPHDLWYYDEVKEYAPKYAGMPNYIYHFTKGDDLFVMCGCYSAFTDETTGEWLFTVKRQDLIALRKLMNEHRNKRCFFIQHIRPPVKMDYDLPLAITPDENGEYVMKEHGYLPISFFRHFKNLILFHGHSHTGFAKQDETSLQMNYMTKHYTGSGWVDLGHRGVHIPSCGIHGEGYIVEVYENGVYLRGVDLYHGKELPISNYWIDTTLVEVDAY